MTVTVREVVEILEAAYCPALAASWDAVGLVCGDPAEPVHRVVIAVDPVAETVAGTLEREAQLLSRVIDAISGGLDLGRVLQGVTKLVTETTGADVCFVHLLDERGRTLRLHGATPPFDQLVGKIELGLGEGVAGWVASHGEPAVRPASWGAWVSGPSPFTACAFASALRGPYRALRRRVKPCAQPNSASACARAAVTGEPRRTQDAATPSSGPTIGTRNTPLSKPVFWNPAAAVNSRGPKSRAGLMA